MIEDCPLSHEKTAIESQHHSARSQSTPRAFLFAFFSFLPFFAPPLSDFYVEKR